MKVPLPLFSLVVSLASLPIGALHVVLAALRLKEPSSPVSVMFAVLQAILGVLQVVPGAGFIFAIDRDKPWSPAKKAAWMLWVVVSVPLVAASLAVLALALLG